MPTMQERLQDKRARKRRHIKKLISFLVILVVLLAGVRLITHRPGFAFGDIVITGTKMYTKQDIVRLSGTTEPINLFRMSRSTLVRALKEDVRVADVSVSYGLGTLKVNVVERKPVLYLQNAFKNYVKIDADGLVLDIGSGLKDATVPLCSGISCGDAYIGDKIAVPEIKDVLKFMSGITDEAKAQISEIIISPDHQAQVRLKYGFPVVLGLVDEMGLKSEIFMTVFNEIKDKKIQVKYIDLQYSKPFIKLK
jgi:cell division protein FtsQ